MTKNPEWVTVPIVFEVITHHWLIVLKMKSKCSHEVNNYTAPSFSGLTHFVEYKSSESRKGSIWGTCCTCKKWENKEYRHSHWDCSPSAWLTCTHLRHHPHQQLPDSPHHFGKPRTLDPKWARSKAEASTGTRSSAGEVCRTLFLIMSVQWHPLGSPRLLGCNSEGLLAHVNYGKPAYFKKNKKRCLTRRAVKKCFSQELRTCRLFGSIKKTCWVKNERLPRLQLSLLLFFIVNLGEFGLTSCVNGMFILRNNSQNKTRKN